MRYVSAILSRIGGITGSGSPDAGDAQRLLSPVLFGDLPHPVQNPANLGTLFADSFTMINQGTITNTGGGLSQSACSLVPGIWDLSFILDFEFNWLDANPLATDAVMKLRQDAASDIFVFQTAARVSRTLLHLPTRRYVFDRQVNVLNQLGGNGVGQTSTFNAFITGNRIL